MSILESIDRLDSLEQTRTFITSIIHEAYKTGNELQVVEFEAKLANIDEEIKNLLQ